MISTFARPVRHLVRGAGVALAAGVACAAPATAGAAVPSALDGSFGGGDGRVEIAGSAARTHATLHGTAALADGRILGLSSVQGGARPILRTTSMLPGGAPDPAWGGDGVVETPLARGIEIEGAALAVQADGRVVIGVNGIEYGERNFLVRLGADGVADATFGGGDGIVGWSNNEWAVEDPKLVLQADGHILFGMSGDELGLSLTRFAGNGTRDLAWGTDGEAMLAVTQSRARGYSFVSPRGMGVDPAGRVVGAFFETVATVQCVRYRCRVTRHITQESRVRLTATGRPDTTYGTSGVARNRSVQAAAGGDALVQPDGRLVSVAPSRDGRALEVRRYGPGGGVDTSFGNRGLTRIMMPALTGRYDTARLARTPDGAVVVIAATAGTSEGGWHHFAQFDDVEPGVQRLLSRAFGPADADLAVVRLRADGSLDRSFDRTVRELDLSTRGDDVDALAGVAVDPAGRVIIAASTLRTVARRAEQTALIAVLRGGAAVGTEARLTFTQEGRTSCGNTTGRPCVVGYGTPHRVAGTARTAAGATVRGTVSVTWYRRECGSWVRRAARVATVAHDGRFRTALRPALLPPGQWRVRAVRHASGDVYTARVDDQFFTIAGGAPVRCGQAHPRPERGYAAGFMDEAIDDVNG